MAINTYTCASCGVVFTANRNPHRDNKFYCSPECQRKGRRNRVSVTCEQCGHDFDVHPTRLRRFKVRYCSRDCKTAAGRTELTCRQCGETVNVQRHIIESGKYAGFCSYDCAADWQKGENHSNWQGGHDKWRGSNWIRQKNSARKRDGYTCQQCGVTEGDLGRPMDVHHIRPWREFDHDWKRANRLDNLISLCPRCHTTIERGGKVNLHSHTTPAHSR